MNPYTKFHILSYANADGSHDVHVSEEAADILQLEKFAQLLMNADDYLAYIRKNGYHFTPTLADTVTQQLVNADGSKHHWTTEQVKTAMMNAGMKENPLNMTWGDASYLANWFYSDEYPDPLATETAVLKRTYKAIQDPDGYEGMTFARWLSDVVMRQWPIDWAAYM